MLLYWAWDDIDHGLILVLSSFKCHFPSMYLAGGDTIRRTAAEPEEKLRLVRDLHIQNKIRYIYHDPLENLPITPFEIFKLITMKSSSFLPVIFLGMFLFCLASCGGQNDQNDKEMTDSVANDTATTATTAAPSTIVSTPQNMMIVTHKVADFDKWLKSYEAHDSLRLVNGIHSYVIGRGVNDPNMILVATKVDDIEKAKAFGKSADLKQAMQKGGVTGKPVVRLTTMTYQDTGAIGTDLRSRTTFTVKDWDKWQRSFDSTRQVRLDNGVIERAYGHEADDNKKVTVVVAVTDTAKANTFWKSDQLKKIRAGSGVTSEPDRFVFRVVKRY